jgi:tetratricopeptide (TPR) repeat protein
MRSKIDGPLIRLAVVALQAVLPISATAQGNFMIVGTVSLPNGNPAAHVIVRISALSGMTREINTDAQGRYEFIGLPAGRYRMTVVNPEDPDQFIDPVDADTSRSAGNRLLIYLYLRTSPSSAKSGSKPGVVTLAEASQQIPKDARKAYEDAVRLKRDNKADKALASVNRAIEIYPEYFQALAERGELRITKGQIAEAAEDFDRALKLNENYGPALRGAGYCKLEQQKFSEAIRYFEQAISTEPRVARTHLFLGIANLALDQREPARKALQQALKIDADQAVTAHVYLADLYAREEHYREAADELRAYLEARPTAPNAARLKAKEADLRARSKHP